MSAGRTAFYDAPELYDLVHAEGSADEAWLLDRLFARHARGAPKAALEPACGTGRCLDALLRRGWEVEGYDLNPRMLAFVRRRLAGRGARARIRRGDMRTYAPEPRFGLVFNLISTFRHLLTDRDALAHLRSCAAALAPNGIFVLGLDLAAYGEDLPDEEAWTARGPKGPVRHVMLTLPPRRSYRRERIINFVTAPSPRGERVLESSYDLRSYDAGELSRLIARSPLKIAAVYGNDGRPARLGGPERALWLVLKSRESASRRGSRAV